MILILGAVLVALFAGSIVYVRSLSHDAATWHVDPQTAPDPSTPNWYRVGPDEPNRAPVFDVGTAELSAALDRVVASQSNIELLQDDRSTGGPVTWVQRSALFGFPDYVSVKVLPSGDQQSTVAMFSRARLGQSDLGVNEKRVTAWLAELAIQVGGR